MESMSPIDCFIFDRKCFHIFKIETLSIDDTTSESASLSDLLFKFNTEFDLLDEISLLSLQKKSSTGANSGVYCVKYIHDQSLSFR